MGKRLVLAIVFGLTSTLVVVAPVAAAQTRCGVPPPASPEEEATWEPDILTGTYDTVIVPEGTICVLEGATVRDNVQVKRGGSVDLIGATVGGNVNGEAESGVFINGSTVGGNVIGQLLSGVFVDASSVGGNVTGEAESFVVISGSTVGGNVHTKRDAGTQAADSEIRGNYSCDGCYFEDLYSVTVHGNMHVRSAELGDFVCNSWIGGSLMIRDSRTVDDASGDTVYTFEIAFSVVGGNTALVNNDGPILISQNDLGGNLTLDRNDVRFTANYGSDEGCGISQSYDGGEVSSNTIAGNVLVQRNTGDVNISSNTIGGKVACVNNSPAPSGGGNTAASKRGQCASL